MRTDGGILTFRPLAPSNLDTILKSIASTVECLGQRQGWGDFLTYRVNLVLDELTTNIISYGRNKDGNLPRIDIRIVSGKYELLIEISDDGCPFDPLTDAPKAPVIDENTEIAPVGGLGLHLVRCMMDSMSYSYEDGRNRLTMTARSERCAQTSSAISLASSREL